MAQRTVPLMVAVSNSNVITFPAPEQDLVRIEPGVYAAVYVRHQVRQAFGGARLAVQFSITTPGGAFEKVLTAWYRVRAIGKGFTVGRHSKFARDWRLLFGRPAERWDRVPMSSLIGVGIRVRVRLVAFDHDGEQLAEVNQYSVVERVLGRQEP
ncbi:MAG TPA: hypothetical protein VES65_11355 [Solirubrobacteraceae bacterium]|nr:hypothetical protein [Solirubrobacteraceae bacterium]